MNYMEFLQSNLDIAEETGFKVEASAINPALKPHQRDAVLWALKGGRRALFESFGLGKTIQQLHVCPLQIDIMDRLIDRYSNPGDTILDPFGGIMTVPTEAVKKGRKGIGVELNADYFRDGVGYLQCADNEQGMPTLFDFIDCGGIAQ